MYQGCTSSSNSPRWDIFIEILFELHNLACGLGLNVVEVAHDIQAQVARHITSDLSLLNSYDTWHGLCIYIYTRAPVILTACSLGTKSVAKQLYKITHGCRRDMGITWFPELTDKCKLTYIKMTMK